eukprot:scaffold528_cov126-Isochrysis_galbana.AAC.9
MALPAFPAGTMLHVNAAVQHAYAEGSGIGSSSLQHQPIAEADSHALVHHTRAAPAQASSSLPSVPSLDRKERRGSYGRSGGKGHRTGWATCASEHLEARSARREFARQICTHAE